MWRPILTYTVVFVTLFVAHIIAAVNDFDIIFRVIAGLITVQTLFAGFILHLLKGNARHARVPVIGLGAGLGWAYAGMQLSWSIPLWVFATIVIQYGTEKGLKYDMPAEATDG